MPQLVDNCDDMDTDDGNPESTVPSIKSLHTLILDLPPSCIEFSKAEPYCFVVGTYELLEQDVEAAADADQAKHDEEQYAVERGRQKRSGSLILFQIETLKVYVCGLCVVLISFASLICLPTHLKPVWTVFSKD